MIRRWLKIIRAEAYRDVIMTLRYPLDMATGILVMYAFFMGIYTGAKSLAGTAWVAAGHDAVVIAFTMWFFAIMAMNTMSFDIESEARQGTLEQVYIHAPDYLGLLWVRSMIHLMYGSWVVIALCVLIQLTTGKWLHLDAHNVLPLIGAVFFGLIGLCGLGLLLGALSLVFKRIGQLGAIVQFGLFFLAFAKLEDFSPAAQALMMHLPLVGLVNVMRGLVASPGAAEASASAFLWLAADSLLLAVIGSLIFRWGEYIARKAGNLSHY